MLSAMDLTEAFNTRPHVERDQVYNMYISLRKYYYQIYVDSIAGMR